MTLTIVSWPLARSLGVTRTPPSEGIEYIEVRVEGGPMLFWKMDPQVLKEKAL